jgi:hypothetical protein
VEVRFCDETDWGFGWIAPEPAFMERTAHALAADGRVWVTDALGGDGVVERIRALGEPAGVIQLLDRHARDCAALARELGVPHHAVPHEPIAGAPFEFLLVRKGRRWQEVALWWPERRVLVCADALGTARYYRAREEPLAVHPVLRVIPPRKRLGGISPRHVLTGHGAGIHGDRAEPAFREALATARRRIPAWAATAARGHGPGRRRR